MPVLRLSRRKGFLRCRGPQNGLLPKMQSGISHQPGILPKNEKQTGIARYDGVMVENCCVWDVSRWGIAVGYTYQHARFAGAELQEEWFRKYGHENIILRNSDL